MHAWLIRLTVLVKDFRSAPSLGYPVGRRPIPLAPRGGATCNKETRNHDFGGTSSHSLPEGVTPAQRTAADGQIAPPWQADQTRPGCHPASGCLEQGVPPDAEAELPDETARTVGGP